MIAYAYDKNGFYVGEVKRQKNPMKKDDYFMPAMATSEEPPVASEG